MTNPADASARFAATFAARCPGHFVREETETDRSFLLLLFTACSPLANSLPIAMIEQQAWLQDVAFREDHPSAPRWIVLHGDTPIGRIIVDWDLDGTCHGIDVAILPGKENVGKGAVLLSAWIATADWLGRNTSLQVLASNRAYMLYHRLGFKPVGDLDRPSITMVRPVGANHCHEAQ